ncbi:hypothetical protein AAC387_Pa06g1716 [Persea americana]
MWKQVKDNLRACLELFRPVCMSKCRKMWKDHKNKMKMQHWKPHQDAPDILERVPKGVLPDQWPQLVRYWTSEETKTERGSYECAEPDNAGSRTQVGDSTHHPGPPRVPRRGRSGRQDVRLDAFSRSSPPGGCSYLCPVSVTPGGVARGGAQFAIAEG